MRSKHTKLWCLFALFNIIIMLFLGCVPDIPSIPPRIPIPAPTIPGGVTLTDLSDYGKKSFNNPNLDALQGRNIYTAVYWNPDSPDVYTQSGFKGMLWAENPGSPEGIKNIAARSKVFKAISWFYAPGYGLSGPDTKEGIEYATKNFLKEEDILVDPDGNLIKRPNFWAEQKLFPYLYSIFSDNYVKYLKNILKNLIDNDIYAITFDDPYYMSGMLATGLPCNTNIIEQFKAHLKNNYDASYLKTRFGIDNLDSFDYRSYIKTAGKDLGNPAPLVSEYILFLQEKTESVIRGLKEYANQEAGKKGRKFIIGGNTPVLHPYQLRMFDVFDYYTGEFFLYSGDPQRTSTVSKVIESISNKPFLYYTSIETSGLNIPQKVDAIAKEQMADVYSHPSGAYIGSIGNHIKTVKDGYFLSSPPSFDWSITGSFSRFMDKNDFLFNGLKSEADVGVMYSLPSMLGGHGYSVNVESKSNQNDKSLWGTLMLLQDAGVQFKVIFNGDSRVYTKNIKLDAAELKQYKTLILPQVFSISDENLDTILKYVEDGGTVVAIGSFATHDEKGAVKQRSKINNLVSEGEHNYGKGKFVFISDNYGARYHEAAVSSNKLCGPKDILDSFNSKAGKYFSKMLSLNVPHGVAASAYSAPNGEVVYLVNYNLNPEKQEFSPVTSATVSLKKENTQVYFFDPNREAPLLITNGDPLSFESLGVLFYTSKDWAKSKWEQIKGDVSKLSGVKVQEALKLAEQENYLGAYSSGTEALKQPKKVLYDEAHDSAYSLTWEGASKINPKDPFGQAMRTYRTFLEDRFDLQVKTSGQLITDELSTYSLVIIDTPKSFTPAEIAALGRYIEKGGHVLLFSSGKGTQSINDFLSGYGIKYDLSGDIKKTKDYIDWYTNFMVSDFKVFALDPVFLSGSRALRVNTPSIALGATDADVYIDKNYNDAMDTNEEKGPFSILAAYKNRESGGMLIVYTDHSQQDYILDVRGTLGIQLALLDLAVNG